MPPPASTLTAPARARPWPALIEVAGVAGLLVLIAASLVLAVDAAANPPHFLVPEAPHGTPAWIAGPLRPLGLGADSVGWRGLGVLLSAMSVCWLVVLACARALRPAAVIAAIVIAHVIYLLAPPLLSGDVVGYIGLAREGAVHGVNPYTHGWAAALAHDPIHPLLAWHNIRSAYGPLFTIFSYALVPLGIHAQLWIYKVLSALSSLGICWLVWRLAKQRDTDPRFAVALVGLNPAVLVFEVGGGHNDALIVLIALVGVALTLRDRPGLGMAAIVAAAASKISMAVVAPFALIGSHDRRRSLTGGVVAFALTAIAGAIAFGVGAGGFLDTLPAASHFVAAHAFPVQVVRRIGGTMTFTHTDRLVADAVVAAGGLAALWWAWRGGDWIAAAGWAMLAVLVGTVWLLPWYVLWLLPFAALGRNRPLTACAIAFTLFVIATRVSFLLA